FHDQDHFRFNFLVHETDGQPDGLIPLVFNSLENRHELFGGSYADSRVLWIQSAHFPECFEALPENTTFFDLQGSWVDGMLAQHPGFEPNFVERDDQFFVSPAEFDYSFDSYMLQRFSKDRRKGFEHDLKKIRARNPELSWGAEDETELFFQMTIKNFGEESDHATESGRAEVRRVVKELQDMNALRTLTIRIDGEKQATSMSCLFKNMMVVLYAGSNNDYDNLGKLLNIETIQEGCRLQVGEVNYMTGTAWKAAWKMNRNPCRTMRKPARELPAAEAPAG
ncbi:MAG: GNAT family N-acetyltransferase, partial [Gammaproteobacteria bacterium]